MRTSVMKDLSDRSEGSVILKLTSESEQSSYRITREEALRMNRQLRSVLRALELTAGTAGSGGIIFREESREDEIKTCRREVSELKRRLGQITARLDVLSFE